MALYKIKEFPQDGAFWRIDWIGKARPNIDVETEPSLLIHLSKLKPGYRDSLSNGSLTDDQVTKTVGLGLLPLLPAGSVWKDGRLHAHIPPNKREVFEIDTSQEVIQAFNGKIRVGGNDSDVIPFWHYPVRKHYPALQDAPLAVFPAIKGRRFDYYIIPRCELFRFYYACSSGLTRYVWDNSIESAINPRESGRLEGGDVRIYLRRHMLDREAYMLARWHASDEMARQIQTFRSLRTRLSANRSRQDLPALHLVIGFPFNGRTKLVAAGKSIKLCMANESGREVWAFLALHLQRCEHPMPFRNIVVDRENRNLQGENKDDDDLQMAWPRNRHGELKGPDDAPDNGGESDTPFASSEEPLKNIQAKVVDTYGQQFDLSRHRLVKEEVEVQKYRSAKVLKAGEAIVDQFGTGEGTYGESSTGPANVTSTPDQSSEKHRVTLQIFVEALGWIREQPGINSVETLALGGSSMLVDGETLYLLPDKIRGLRTWHRIKSVPDRNRGIMVAMMATADNTFYLMEIERRGEDDCFSTLVLTTGGIELQEENIRAFLTETARSHGWPERVEFYFPHIQRRTENHYKTDTAMTFGGRLIAGVT